MDEEPTAAATEQLSAPVARLLPLTSKSIPPPETFDNVRYRRNLTVRATNLLKAGQIHVKYDGKVYTRNDMDEDSAKLKEITRFVRLSNLSELVLSEYRNTISLPNHLLSPSMFLVKFLLYPWTFAGPHNLVGQNDLQKFFSPPIGAVSTSVTEHDTGFPSLAEHGSKAVVVGLTESIKEHLGGRLDYKEACMEMLHKITLGQNSADFPILAGLEHQQVLRTSEEEVHVIDFYRESKTQLGQSIVPLMLTTCGEVKSRVQLQYLELLYGMGAVVLNPKPVDSSKMIYMLADDDPVSVKMGLNSSKSVLFSVSVVCHQCSASNHELWTPGIEARDPMWLSNKVCYNCRQGPLENRSCFVLKSASGKMDPSSIRKINYFIPSGHEKRDFPEFEHVCTFTNGKNLKLHIRVDPPRKNMQGISISAIVYVPVVYLPDLEKLGDSMEVSPSHQLMHVFVEGEEHVLPIMTTRVKMTFTCNRKHELDVQPKNLDEMAQIAGAFKEVDGKTQVSFPSNDCTKRLGVEVRDGMGNVQMHSTEINIPAAKRKDTKKQKPFRAPLVSNMYSCKHYFGTGSNTNENNFRKFGISMAAGFVYNAVAQKPWYTDLTPEDFGCKKIIPAWEEVEKDLFRKSYTKATRVNDKLREVYQELSEKEALLCEKDALLCEKDALIREMYEKIMLYECE